MKRVDEDKRNDTLDKILQKLDSINELALKVGRIKIHIPKEEMYKHVKRLKLWEANSIKDVLDNYEKITILEPLLSPDDLETISRKVRDNIEIPGDMGLKELSRTMKDLLSYKKASQEYLRRQRLTENYHNFNQIMLDNVYLGNFQQEILSRHTLIKFEVMDKWEQSINAIATYTQSVLTESLSTIKNELDNAMSFKDYSVPFDITFAAIPTKEKRFFGTKTYDPEILIHSIKKADGTKKELFPIGIGSFVPSYN